MLEIIKNWTAAKSPTLYRRYHYRHHGNNRIRIRKVRERVEPLVGVRRRHRYQSYLPCQQRRARLHRQTNVRHCSTSLISGACHLCTLLTPCCRRPHDYFFFLSYLVFDTSRVSILYLQGVLCKRLRCVSVVCMPRICGALDWIPPHFCFIPRSLRENYHPFFSSHKRPFLDPRFDPCHDRSHGFHANSCNICTKDGLN